MRPWTSVYRSSLTDLQRAPAREMRRRDDDDRGSFKGHCAVLRVTFAKQLDRRGMAGLLGMQQPRPAADHHPAKLGPVFSVAVDHQSRFAGLLDVPQALQRLARLFRLLIDRRVEAGAIIGGADRDDRLL